MEFPDLVRLGQTLASAVDAVDLWHGMNVVRQFEQLAFTTLRYELRQESVEPQLTLQTNALRRR